MRLLRNDASHLVTTICWITDTAKQGGGSMALTVGPGYENSKASMGGPYMGEWKSVEHPRIGVRVSDTVLIT